MQVHLVRIASWQGFEAGMNSMGLSELGRKPLAGRLPNPRSSWRKWRRA
jgi:hypothetical protein